MNPDATNEVLRFDVGDLRCAVPLSHVREVQRAVAVTPLPGAPEIIDGVIDVRGEVVPVIDLGRRAGPLRRPWRASLPRVAPWTGERLVARRADRAHGREELAPDAVVNASRLTRRPLELAGVARTTDGLVPLQGPEALLRQAESETL